MIRKGVRPTGAISKSYPNSTYSGLEEHEYYKIHTYRGRVIGYYLHNYVRYSEQGIVNETRNMFGELIQINEK